MHARNISIIDSLTAIADELFDTWYSRLDVLTGTPARCPRAARVAQAEVDRMTTQYGPMEPEIAREELRRLTAEYAALFGHRRFQAA